MSGRIPGKTYPTDNPEYKRDNYLKNRDKTLERKKVDRQERPEVYKEKDRVSRDNNRDKRLAYNKKWRDSHRDHRLAYNRSPQGKYTFYRTQSERRGIEFSLTMEEFIFMWQEPCFYCGSEIGTIGLDRVDNKQGYISNNIIPCCTSCNSAKGVKTFDEFMDYLKKVANRQIEMENI